MALGFVLITAEAGKEQDIYRQLLKVPEVAELMPLFGEYDLIAKVRTDDAEQLARTIQERIRVLEGVLDAKTLTASQA